MREQNQAKMTLAQGEFLFHYVSDDGVIALAIAGVEYYQCFVIQTFLRSRLCLWSRRGVQILRLSVGQVLKTVWAESPLSNCLRHEHRVQPRHCQVILVISLGKEVAQFEEFFVFSEIKRFSKKASDSSSAGDPDKITTWAWTLFKIKFLSIVFQYLQWPMIKTSQSC